MGEYKLNWEALRNYCQDVFMKLDVPEDEAFVIADCLVDADLCGVSSHGVSRMTIYTKRLETNVVSRKFSSKVLQEHAGSLHLDGCNSMGMVVGKYAMERSIEKAREHGSCFSAVCHSNHYGMAGYYATMAAKAGMFGFSCTNAPPNIAPWGSPKSYVGTNPIAISVPTHKEPILLDMAPSVVAMGKIILAAKTGKTIPEGWGLTKEGKPTTDPEEAIKGSLVPIGGPKGFGLSLFVDLLSGILTGAETGPHLNNFWNDFVNPQNVGHIFAAVDISKFCGLEVFKDRVGQVIEEVKAMPRNEGVAELFLPGEIEQRNRVRAKEEGIVISDVVFEELRSLSGLYGAEFTL